MTPNRLLTITLWLSLIIIIIVVLTYILNFSDLLISKDPLHWSIFADYFSGILNPLFGIINLLILIYISFQISNLESDRANVEIEIQKQMALYNLKHDALKEISSILEMVQKELITRSEDSELKIILIRNNFNAAITTYDYLFPFFANRTWNSLVESIQELSLLSGRWYREDADFDVDRDLLPRLRTFNDQKVNFVIEIQEKILE